MEKVSGIYRIVCKANSRYYYGSSNNIKTRWITHKRELRNNAHKNSIVQRVWNKYGEPSFKIEIAELVEPARLLEVEDVYLNKYVGKPRCMNINQNAECPPIRNRTLTEKEKLSYKGEKNGFFGKRHSEETKLHLSQMRIGKSPSQETKKKISESMKGIPGTNLGKHLPESTKQKLSEANSGKNHWCYGKRHSEETKKKISETLKRRYKNLLNVG